MQTVQYIDFLPGGNKTALVIGDRFTPEECRIINDTIMSRDHDTEQVGFVQDVPGMPASPSLRMAGGEFCGNASRSAAYYYLNGKPGTLLMTVSGGRQVDCGVYDNGDAWCQIPMDKNGYAAMELAESVAPGIHMVRLSGITHLVLEQTAAAPYLEDKTNLKVSGLKLIEKYRLKDCEAAGAIFLESLSGGSLKINPIVWVRDIASLFYETACGSGTIAAALVLAKKEGRLLSADIVQPSGMVISAEISEDRAVISGPVKTDLILRTIEI